MNHNHRFIIYIKTTFIHCAPHKKIQPFDKKALFTLYCLTGTFVLTTNAQEYLLTGKIINTALEPIPYASISIKELKTGTTSDIQGNFKLQLEAGKYDVIVDMIGYKPRVLTISITKNDTLNVILDQDKGQLLSDVQIIGTRKDHAEEIVKNVIRNKATLLENGNTFSCNIYIKATDENQFSSKQKKGKKDTLTQEQKDLAGMNMAEVYLKADYSYPDKIKEERTAVKIRGNSESLFYLTTTDGDFNFYKNLVQLPALSAMPMLSPISNSGLIAYKYKTLRIRKEKNRTIYTIKVTPTKLGNALVSGEMEIMDSAWVLLSSSFELPKYHLTEYDYFSVNQQYEW